MVPIRRAGDAALTVGAVLGALCLVLTLAALALDVRPLFVRSGSMAPAIGTGSLALARSAAASDLRVGDVVSVPTTAGSRVTHRVVALDPGAGTTRLTLKGDANTVPDAQTYEVATAERVFLDVPWVGYVVGWLREPAGLATLAGFVVLLLLLIGRGGWTSGGAGRRRAEPSGTTRRRRHAVVVTMAAGMVALGPASPTWAAPWTDPVPIGGTTFAAAASVLPPSNGDCDAGSGDSVIVRWHNVDLRYGYFVEIVRNSTGAVVGSTAVTNNGTLGPNQSVVVGPGGLGGGSVINYTARIYTRHATATTWRSTAITVPFFYERNCLLILCSDGLRCA